MRMCAPLDERLISIMDEVVLGWTVSANNSMKRAWIANFEAGNGFAPPRRGRGKPAKSPELIFALAAALAREGRVTTQYRAARLIETYLRRSKLLPPLTMRPDGLPRGYEQNWQSIRKTLNKNKRAWGGDALKMETRPEGRVA